MGQAAAREAAQQIRQLLTREGFARVIFSSAASQVEFLEALRSAPDIDWSKVTIFHLDEYAGMRDDHPASFRRFLLDHLLCSVQPAVFHGIQGESPDLAAECDRYAGLLKEQPPQLGILGIGENGHIAFNDPPVCRFDDPYDVKPVLLDEICRQQQVNDGAFSFLQEVPRVALTVTVSRLLRVPRLLTIVPNVRKSSAVKAALEGPVVEDCPASIFRTHHNISFYLDDQAASLLEEPALVSQSSESEKE